MRWSSHLMHRSLQHRPLRQRRWSNLLVQRAGWQFRIASANFEDTEAELVTFQRGGWMLPKTEQQLYCVEIQITLDRKDGGGRCVTLEEYHSSAKTWPPTDGGFFLAWKSFEWNHEKSGVKNKEAPNRTHPEGAALEAPTTATSPANDNWEPWCQK